MSYNRLPDDGTCGVPKCVRTDNVWRIHLMHVKVFYKLFHHKMHEPQLSELFRLSNQEEWAWWPYTFQRFLSQLCAFLVPFSISTSCVGDSLLQLKSLILDNLYKLPSSHFTLALIFVSPITFVSTWYVYSACNYVHATDKCLLVKGHCMTSQLIQKHQQYKSQMAGEARCAPK